MSDQRVINPKIARRYRERMAFIEANAQLASDHIVEYWYTIYQVYADKDYLAEHDSLEEWLTELGTQPYGPSRQTFHNKRRAIELWLGQGMKEPGIRRMLRSNATMAIEQDVLQLTVPGTTQFRPEVEQAIREGGETPVQALHRIADLSASEARKEVHRLAGNTRRIFYSGPERRGGRLLATVTLMDDDAVVAEYTLAVSCRQTKPVQNETSAITDELARDLSQRLGLRL